MTQIPTEPGAYLAIVNGELESWAFGHQTGWFRTDGDEGNVDPFTATCFIRVESAIDLACKIAFAEMELAWMRRTPGKASQKTIDAYWLCRNGYLAFFERRIEDMQRVTRELRGEE